MELLVASAIGILTASGLYLVLRLRSFPVIMGTSLLTYAVNVFLFASGRLTVGAPPILSLYHLLPVPRTTLGRTPGAGRWLSTGSALPPRRAPSAIITTTAGMPNEITIAVSTSACGSGSV